MCLLLIHYSFQLSPVVLLVAIAGITCAQPRMFPTLQPYTVIAAGAFLTDTNSKMGSKLPRFPGIAVTARANQYSTQAPSSLRCLSLNIHCGCHRTRSFSTPYHLPRCCFTHTKSFSQFPLRQPCLPVHQHISDMCSPSKYST